MIKKGILFLIILSAASCNYFKGEEKPGTIARVNEEYLEPEALNGLVPPGTPKEDSIAIVKAFIDRVVTLRRLVLRDFSPKVLHARVVEGLGGTHEDVVTAVLGRQSELGEHTLEITDEGLVESTSVNRTLLNWRTPFRIRHTKRYGFIFLSPFNSHPVPKLVPPLEGSTPEFLAELQRRIAANKQA